MEHSDGLICNIARKLKEAALRTEKEIMNLFPPLLAYELLTGCQRYISHDFDPPWDSSGFLFSKSSDASFDIGVYKKVGDFFVNYTGNSKATYTSGCGLYHETYGEHYEEWMEEQYRNAHYSVLHMTDVEILLTLARETFGEDNFDTLDMNSLIDDLLDAVEEFEDLSILHAENLRIKISEMDLLFVYKLGEKRAKERLHNEQMEMEQSKKQIELEKAAFNKLWPLLEKKYKLAYQRPFPKRIEMPEFTSFQQFLDDHNVQKQERVLIGKYAPISFSNSVFFKLSSK